MAIQIKDKKSFLKQNERLKRIFLSEVDLPQYVFNTEFKYFLCFEFEFIFSDSFLYGMQKLVSSTDSKNFTFYIENPSPSDYYYKYFNIYNVAIFHYNDTMSTISDILVNNPGNSPADSMVINSFDIAIFSESNKWAIKCSREIDVSVIGFYDLFEQNKFLEQFGSSSDMFFTPKEYLDTSIYCQDEYEELVKNYINIV